MGRMKTKAGLELDGIHVSKMQHFPKYSCVLTSALFMSVPENSQMFLRITFCSSVLRQKWGGQLLKCFSEVSRAFLQTQSISNTFLSNMVPKVYFRLLFLREILHTNKTGDPKRP